MSIKLENLYILNDYDRPCMYLLATKEQLKYACKSMNKKFPHPTEDAIRMTCLKDFGFEKNGDVNDKLDLENDYNPIRIADEALEQIGEKE